MQLLGKFKKNPVHAVQSQLNFSKILILPKGGGGGVGAGLEDLQQQLI